MKNYLRKGIALVLSLAMLAVFSIVAFADDATVSVSLRIEGATECYYYSTVEIDDGATVADVITLADEESDDITVYATESSYGYYLYGINDLYAGSTSVGWDGWLFLVNGESPSVSADYVYVSDGDVIVWYYADPYVSGFQIPVVDISDITDGIIRFTSEDTEYDENWNAVTVTNPVVGATVTYDGETYTTDENGEIEVSLWSVVCGTYSVQIEMYDESGTIPLVLRFAPDYEIEVENTTFLGIVMYIFKPLYIAIQWLKSIFS